MQFLLIQFNPIKHAPDLIGLGKDLKYLARLSVYEALVESLEMGNILFQCAPEKTGILLKDRCPHVG